MSGRGQTSARTRARTRGMALVNALVIVAALAGVATVLLTRAHTAMDRLEGQQRADQAARYLDGAEWLARYLVGVADAPHHRAQGWAQPHHDEPIDRGTAGWRIDDLQGRYNLNWLMLEAGADSARIWDARAALIRLARALDVPESAATRLADAAGADQRRRENAFAAPGARIRPPPQPLALVRQLGSLPGIEAAHWARLAPHLAALPPDSALNVNTAPLPVLGAMLPLLDAPALDVIDARRRAQPFESVSDFVAWVAEALEIELEPAEDPPDEPGDGPGDGPGVAPPEPLPELTATSDWFLAELTARLDTVVLHRTVVLQRDRPGEAARAHLTWHGTD